MNRYLKGVALGFFVGTVAGICLVVKRNPLLYYKFRMRKNCMSRSIMRKLKQVRGVVSSLGRIITRRYEDINRQEGLDQQFEDVNPLA
jgi:hypothetical protein